MRYNKNNTVQLDENERLYMADIDMLCNNNNAVQVEQTKKRMKKGVYMKHMKQRIVTSNEYRNSRIIRK